MSPRSRPTAAAVVALALVAMLAVASGGMSVLAPSGGEGADRVGIVIVVAALFGVGLPAGALVALSLRRVKLARAGHDTPDAPPRRVTLVRALPPTIFVVVVASLVVISRGDLRRAVDGSPGRSYDFPGQRTDPLSVVGWFENTRVRAGEGEPDPEATGAADPESDRRKALLLMIVVAGGAVGAGLLWRVIRPQPVSDHDGLAGEGARRAAHGAIVGTIDAMLSDPDPKTAIIGAYARLLEGLGSSGMPRRDYEGPMEHLHRVLTVLDVRPAPARRLIELFELARFSSHRLTPKHRDAALDGLRTVAADLAGTAPSHASAGSPITGPRITDPPTEATAGAGP